MLVLQVICKRICLARRRAGKMSGHEGMITLKFMWRDCNNLWISGLWRRDVKTWDLFAARRCTVSYGHRLLNGEPNRRRHPTLSSHHRRVQRAGVPQFPQLRLMQQLIANDERPRHRCSGRPSTASSTRQMLCTNQQSLPVFCNSYHYCVYKFYCVQWILIFQEITLFAAVKLLWCGNDLLLNCRNFEFVNFLLLHPTLLF